MAKISPEVLPEISTQPYWIQDKEQISCLASAVRMDIVDNLTSAGPASIKEIAFQIGMKPSALYHHFHQLEKVGLVRVFSTRVVDRKTEKLYATPSRKMRLIKALGDRENASEMGEIVNSLARSGAKEFSTAIEKNTAEPGGPYRNLGFYRTVNRPSKAALKEINQKLEEIAELLWEEQDVTQPLVSLSWVMAPINTK